MAILASAAANSASAGVNIYASPTGLPTHNGSINAPVDLATALSSPAVPLGATIWLRGGTYAGFYTSYLTGTQSEPITVRGYPGERATISDSRNWADGATLHIYGAWTIYQDFEVTNTGTDRRGPAPAATRFRPMGIEVEAPYTKLINLVIHDTGHGMGVWADAPGAEMYGNIIYNCGSQNTPGVMNMYGHGMYVQNDTAQKLISDNIIFNQFGWGISIYPNPGGIKDITMEGNIIFDNGINTAPTQRYNAVGVSGYPPYTSNGIIVSNNYTYDSGAQVWGSVESDANMCLGCYDQLQNGSLSVTGNYFAGGMPSGILKGWQQLTFSGNTTVGFDAFYLLDEPQPGTYTWNNNTYAGGNSASPGALFLFQNSLYNFTGWQAASGFDEASQYVPGRPTAVAAFVRPNAYEAGRGNVVVYNWPLRSSIALDLSTILTIGSTYNIVNVLDYYGPPVASGTYTGGLVIFPLSAVQPVPAIGWTAVRSSGPEFNAFVVTSQ